MCVIGPTIMGVANHPGEYPLSADGSYWKRIADNQQAELRRLHVRIERLEGVNERLRREAKESRCEERQV